MRNVGGRFEDVTDRAGRAFELVEASRGAAFGDVDNDGDTDVLVANGAGPRAAAGQRDRAAGKHWIGLRLVGRDVLRDMLGARVGVVRSNGPVLWRRARADGSYASANDPRVLAGLGDSTGPPRIRVIWPTGETEEWDAVAIDRYTTLRQGAGQ